jgi:hypothetical protein
MSFAGYTNGGGVYATPQQQGAPSFVSDPIGWIEDFFNPTGSWNTVVNPPGQAPGSGSIFSNGSGISAFGVFFVIALIALALWFFKR